MKRFTERDEFGNADIIGVDSMNLQGNLGWEELRISTKALNRLAELEDKLESGELGNVEQAVKEFAEELKSELKPKQVKYGIYTVTFSEGAIEAKIDNLVNKLYPSCDTCPDNNNAEYNERNCPRKGECGK